MVLRIRGLPSVLLALCAAIAVSGCSLVDSGLQKNSSLVSAVNESTTGGAGGTPLQAFQTGFYAFAQKNCIQCHGSSQSPLFAISNVSAAYNNALPYADFSNPANSVIVQYAGNGHCGISNCSGSAQSSAVLNDVNLWAAAENNSGLSGGGGSGSGGGGGGGNSGGGGSGSAGLVSPSPQIAYFSAPVPIPTNLPGAGTKFAIMRWNLSNLTPGAPAVAGAYFEVQIQLLTPSVYRIASPKLAVPGNASVDVSGIHVMIRPSSDSGYGGEYTLGMDWNSINTIVAPTTIPKPLPTTSLNVPVITTDTIPMPVQSSSDELILGFEGLSVSSAGTSCKNLNGTNGFETNVKPQMQQICFQCHLQGGGGYGFFPMVSNNDAQLCATTLKHVNLANPSQSDIVVRPEGGDGHPDFSGIFNPTPFIQWIQTE